MDTHIRELSELLARAWGQCDRIGELLTVEPVEQAQQAQQAQTAEFINLASKAFQNDTTVEFDNENRFRSSLTGGVWFSWFEWIAWLFDKFDMPTFQAKYKHLL
jgi:hypothetical protein